jgi:aminoglycoside phosphotransferase (APT) family kinase protein
MSTAPDGTGLDLDALASWIAREEGIPASGVRIVAAAPIDSVGNAREPWRLTVVLEPPGRPERAVDAVLLLKAPAGQLETAMPVEHAALRAVQHTGVPAPAPLWLDATGAAVGRPFLATTHMPGTADMALLRAAPDDTEARQLAEHLAEVAARLHTVDPARVDPAVLPRVDVAGAATAQLDVWEPLAERQRLEPLPALRRAFSWLRANAPVAERVSLVHGDLRVGNFLAHGGRVQALLDWEMAHLGDPLEDVAWAYRALWSPARVLPFDAFVARWSAHSGLTAEPRRLLWYRMFNEVKHGVISLTAGRAFHERRTTNLRLADRNLTVAPFLDTFFRLRREHDAVEAAR